MSVLFRNATLVTMNDRMEVAQGDLSVRDGRIAALGHVPDGAHDRVIDAAGDLLLPGFVQTHVHLCQTLFRGLADDLSLMDWLRTRVWPLEAAHTDASLRASARLAACELLRGGTTSILTMETVHDTDVVFDEIARSGLRATIGKCMMDDAADAPARLKENTNTSIGDALTLFDRWHDTHDGRIRVAFAPRFAVSCSRRLLEAVAVLAAERGLLVHTHASESRGEIALVQKRTGMDNIAYLVATGLASSRLCAAHCVHVDDTALGLLAEFDVKVLHCPEREPEARLRPRARRRDGAPADHGVARRRRRGLQQPPRHVRRNAPGGAAAGQPPRAGRADGARRGVDGHARRRQDARPGQRDRQPRARQEGRSDSRRAGRPARRADVESLLGPRVCRAVERPCARRWWTGGSWWTKGASRSWIRRKPSPAGREQVRQLTLRARLG